MITSTGVAGSRRLFPLILLLFVGSGGAALIYEIVWFQVLQLVIGGSAVSLAVLLGAFMGGMFAGALLLARHVSAARHPLRVFAALEAAIGVCGALLIVVMPLVGRLYTVVDGGGPSSILLRALASVLLLLPPAMVMGATLPAISRYVEATPSGTSRLGLCYGANLLGAVLGCLFAGFYLLPAFDLASASLAAVGLNAIVAIGALLLSRRMPYTPRLDATVCREDAGRSALARSPSWDPPGVYTAIALSGFTALGAEVVWTRLLSLLFGATTYTFSMILAVFLLGLGIGNTISAALARRSINPRALLGGVQLALSFAIAYGAWMATRTLPYWSVDTSLAPAAALDAQTDLLRALVAMLPGAVLWGMSFPLAVSAAIDRASDAAATVGRVYAANTLGAVVGAVLTPLAVIPLIGTHGAQRVLIVASAVSAVVTLLPLTRPSATKTQRAPRPALGSRALLMLALATTGAIVAASSVSRVPAGLVAWGRLLPWHGEPVTLFVGEGANASIAVTEESNGWRNFHVSGKVEASTEPQDMRLQRLLGHLTALMHDGGPTSALVVGFGAGVTAGAVSIHPSVERMVICELEPLIPRVVSRYFGDVNHAVLTDLKVRLVYDDARHYVLTARETFDVITSDPIHPWVKGAATLYTREYFEHVRSRLNPGGVVTQWVPLYESTEESVRSVIATFFRVFPNGTIWRNDDAEGRGYDAVLVGRADSRPIDIDAWQARIDDPAYRKVKDSLADVGFETAVDLLSTYLGRREELAPWLAGAEINTDSNLRLQYLAGAGVNDNTGTEIRDALLRYRRFPDGLFAGTPETMSSVRSVLAEPDAP